MNLDKEILTIDEAAAYLQMHKISIYKLIKQKKIPHTKILTKFRFVKADLEKWVGGV